MIRPIAGAFVATLFASSAIAQTCSPWSAWARFKCNTTACMTGSVPPTIEAGGNASGVSRWSAGGYTLNFTTLPTSNTSYACTGSNVTSSGTGSQLVFDAGQTQASISFQTLINGGPFADPTLYGFIDCKGF